MCAKRVISEDHPFAQRLREILPGKTNVEICKITELNYASVTMYMNGKMKPSLEFIVKLALHGYDILYVLTGKKTTAVGTSDTTAAISASGIDTRVDVLLNIVLQNWGKIDPELKGRVAGLILGASERA